MDFNHDYNDGENPFLVVGAAERLQACKTALLAFGDLGYTDPPIPDIRDAIGDYTDLNGMDSVKRKVREILTVSQVVRDSELLSVDVVSPVGDDRFTIEVEFTFGRIEVDAAAIL